MPFSPYVMRSVNLVFSDTQAGGTGTDFDFQCQVTSVTLTPDVSVERIQTLCPDGQFSDVSNPEWTISIGYLNGDVASGDTPPEAIADYLLEHFGEKKWVTFRPKAGGKGYQVQVTIIPGSIGGDQGSWSEGSVDLPVDGQPVKVDPATGTVSFTGTPADSAAVAV